MKTKLLIFVLLSFIGLIVAVPGSEAQVTMLLSPFSYKQMVQNSASQNFDASKLQENAINSIPTFSISGLGNSQLSTTNPSPNLNVQFNIYPGTKKKVNFFLNFNLGITKTSKSLDSISLLQIFYPDNSTVGFSGGFTYDFLSTSQSNGFPHLNSIKFGVNQNDYNYYSLPLTISYSYHLLNISNANFNTDSFPSKIESSSIYAGIAFAGHWEIDKNPFVVSFGPYIKYQYIASSSQPTYQHIFKSSNNNSLLPTHFSSWGLNTTAEFGKVQLSFIYEDVLSNSIQGIQLKGGVYLLKVSIIADFLSFNFAPAP
jgi:hypothetical protein